MTCRHAPIGVPLPNSEPWHRRHRTCPKDTIPVSDDQSVTGLVTRARNGGKQAWGALVERYAPLIWSI